MMRDTFYNQPCHTLSVALLNKLLCRRLTDAEVNGIPEAIRRNAQATDGEPLIKARIVEVESYPSGDDKATHSCNGRRTARTEPMFMKPGTAYVYLIYGLYHCINISAQEPGAAVLIRGLETVRGEEWARALRSQKARRKPPAAAQGVFSLVTAPPVKSNDIYNGPSRLCQALGIDRAAFNKHDLALGDRLWIEEDDVSRTQNSLSTVSIVQCTRIGVDGYGAVAAGQPWRWYIRNSGGVSKRDRKAEASQGVKMEAMPAFRLDAVAELRSTSCLAEGGTAEFAGSETNGKLTATNKSAFNDQPRPSSVVKDPVDLSGQGSNDSSPSLLHSKPLPGVSAGENIMRRSKRLRLI